MKSTNKKGFTLVELLIVIVVIGILFIVVVANVDFSTDAAKEAGVQSTFQSYKLAAETAALEYNGFLHDEADLIKYLNKRLDSELQFKVNDDGSITGTEDPWGTEFRFVKTEPINAYGQIAITSAGPDMEFDTNDDMIMAVKYVIMNGRGEAVTTYPEYDEDHVHSYTVENASAMFLKAPATCSSKALYYRSCECGEMNGTTFEAGEINPDRHSEIEETHERLDSTNHTLTRMCMTCRTVVETVTELHNGDGSCEDCGEVLHEHSFTQQVQTSEFKLYDADCTKPLTYYYSCECGQAGTETFTIGTTTSHNFTKETTDYFASAATCKKPAQYYYSCTGCNAKGTETYSVGTVNLTNHIGDDVTTYTSAGTQHYKIVKCDACGEQKSSTLENHSPTTGTCTLCNNHTHTWTETATAANNKSDANCQSAAVYYKSCSCGEKNMSSTFTVGSPDPDKHVGEIVNGNSADVHTKYSVCEHAASTTHSYSETIITNATCTTNGSKALTCGCGYVKTETIPAQGHNTEGRDTTYLAAAANCDNAAQYYKTCSVCHTKQSNETFSVGEPDLTNHIGEEDTTYVALNSTQHNKIIKCLSCGGEKSVTPEAHDDELACTICNNHVHQFEELVTSDAFKSSANCITPATYYKSCSCGLNDTEHTFTVGSVDKTIHADGCTIVAVSTSSKCREYELCHTEVPGGHDYTETVTQAATCLNAGTLLKDCKYCEYYLTEPISATGHTPGPAASCTTDQVCTVCGAVLDEANGHTYNQQVANSNYFYAAATCQSGALYYKSCSCGAKGSATFVYGLEDEDNHVKKTPIAGGTEFVHSKYECCGATASATHSMTNTGTFSECKRCSCGYATSAHNMQLKGSQNVHSECSYGCGYKVTTHSYADNVIAPTCTDEGFTIHTCTCGWSYNDTYVSETGHSWGNAIWEDEYNDEYHGTCYRICSVCSTRDDAVTIERYNSYSSGDCSTQSRWDCRAIFDNGNTSNCSGWHYGGYNYDIHLGSVINGGTSDAHTIYSVCKHIASSEHNMVGGSSDTYCRKCECGYTIYDHDMKYTNYDATCTEDGYVNHYCNNCNYSYIEAGETCSGHSWDYDWDSSCINCTRTCLKCTEEETVRYSGTHTYESASCNTVRKYDRYAVFSDGTNKSCPDYHYGSSYSHSGTKVEDYRVDATCQSTGTIYYVYSCCGQSYGTSSIAKTGHSPGAAATCTTAQTCTVCGTTITAAKGHSGTKTIGSTVAATCTSTGSTTYVYSGCGCVISTVTIGLKSHSYSSSTGACSCGAVHSHTYGSSSVGACIDAYTHYVSKTCSGCRYVSTTTASHNYNGTGSYVDSEGYRRCACGSMRH